MKKTIAALAATAALVMTTAGTCDGSNGPDHPAGGSSTIPQQKSTGNTDCGYSWNPCSGASAPAGGADRKPSAHPTFTGSGPIRFGDWMFGQCSLSLYPAYVGLTRSGDHLVILAATACVGYQPQEIHIHITLQKYWAPGGARSDWHDTGVTLADSTPPPLVILPPEGDPPLSQQHQIKDAVLCTPHPGGPVIPYRLQIDIVGVSYGGEPIVTGGYGSAFVTMNEDCA